MIFKAVFLINILIAVLKQGFFLVTWYFFFNKYHNLNGWDFHDLLFVYGLLSIGIGTIEIFFYGLKELPFMVEENMLDSYIIQPQNLLLNIALSKGQISSVGDLVTGLVAILFSGYFISHFLDIILLVPLSVIFIFALYLYLSSLSFYIKNSSDFIRELYRNAIIIASQPNSAYHGLLKVFTLTIMPVAFLSFFPIEFIKNSNYVYLFISYMGTFLFLIGAIFIFYHGISKYESGSMLANKY